MRLHILGICGTFMGGIAAIARTAGHVVTGCDANVYPPMSTQLADLGIALCDGYDPAQLQGVAKDADVFVVGNVVSRGNPLLEAILNARRRYVSGPQWLYENVLFDRNVLAVAGTHGKTTTSAMLAHVLERAGLSPAFLIGGVPVDFGLSARLTASDPFVIEADEYDTAFFDKRSKFVHYRPTIAILNNLEFDHADIFSDLAAIETQFHHFVRTIPANGTLVVNAADDALARVLARGAWSRVETFAHAADAVHADWTIDDDGRVRHGEALVGTLAAGPDDANPLASLALPQRGGSVAPGRPSPLMGRHNLRNALAAIAAASAVGVAPADGIAALRAFQGVRRRMELRGCVGGVRVYDDFAHHPTAIATTIDGLRERERAGRILAVLEPRSNTMKLGTMKAALPESLARADRVFCYAAHLGWDAKTALAPLGERARVHDDLAALVADVATQARDGDHVLVMSNGGFGGVHAKLLDALARRALAA